MATAPSNDIGRKVAVTSLTAGVAFVCGWSAGGWAQGLGLAVALGAAGGIAAFSDKQGGRLSCAAWGRRRGGPTRRAAGQESA